MGFQVGAKISEFFNVMFCSEVDKLFSHLYFLLKHIMGTFFCIVKCKCPGSSCILKAM